jgi:hypothetical protein
MKIRSAIVLLWLAIGFAVPTFAQQANDLLGAWTLVSITLNQDGKKTDMLWSQLAGPTEPTKNFAVDDGSGSAKSSPLLANLRPLVEQQGATGVAGFAAGNCRSIQDKK